jgi:hypothetical protein
MGQRACEMGAHWVPRVVGVAGCLRSMLLTAMGVLCIGMHLCIGSQTV